MSCDHKVANGFVEVRKVFQATVMLQKGASGVKVMTKC